MVKYCCSYGCSNEWNPNSNIRFHKFPIKRPDILNLWVQAMRLVNFKPTANTVICGNHFSESSYLETSLNSKLLKKDAIPTIFNFPKHLIKTSTPRRTIIRHTQISPVNVCEEYSIVNTDTEPNTSAHMCNTSNKSTQTSPRKLKKSYVEMKMSRKIKILQQKLHRRDNKIKNMKNLIKHLKHNNQSHESL